MSTRRHAHHQGNIPVIHDIHVSLLTIRSAHMKYNDCIRHVRKGPFTPSVEHQQGVKILFFWQNPILSHFLGKCPILSYFLAILPLILIFFSLFITIISTENIL